MILVGTSSTASGAGSQAKGNARTLQGSMWAWDFGQTGSVHPKFSYKEPGEKDTAEQGKLPSLPRLP